MRVFGGPCWASGETRVGQVGDVLGAQWSRQAGRVLPRVWPGDGTLPPRAETVCREGRMGGWGETLLSRPIKMFLHCF